MRSLLLCGILIASPTALRAQDVEISTASLQTPAEQVGPEGQLRGHAHSAFQSGHRQRAGVVGLALYKPTGAARPWTSGVGGLYTDSKSWAVAAFQKAYLGGDKYRVTAGVGDRGVQRRLLRHRFGRRRGRAVGRIGAEDQRRDRRGAHARQAARPRGSALPLHQDGLDVQYDEPPAAVRPSRYRAAEPGLAAGPRRRIRQPRQRVLSPVRNLRQRPVAGLVRRPGRRLRLFAPHRGGERLSRRQPEDQS